MADDNAPARESTHVTLSVAVMTEARELGGNMAQAAEMDLSNEWPIVEIQATLKKTERGDFASNKDVAALAAKWK